MLKETEKYIEENSLFTKKDKILIALSGGADSMVLTDILIKSGYKCAVAHCNFKLRKDDSDKDENFVKNFAETNDIQAFTTSFNTKEFAENNKYSIEEAARILRYEWFEKIRINNDFDFIATAHHSDDNIETFFINLTAGTGIRGLSGIKNKNNKIVRPLLFAKRQDIDEYCLSNKMDYCIDKTNFETKYIRNKFRHNVLPAFQEINPAFSDIMIKNISIISDIEKIYFDTVEKAKRICQKHDNNLIYINIEKLNNLVSPKTFLYEFLRPYNFNSSQNNDIFKSISNESGKQFFSKTHKLIKDRNELIIKKKNTFKSCVISINKGVKQVASPLPLKFEIISEKAKFKLQKERTVACLDADKISFPLTIRNWKTGDYFYPLGMKGKKKRLSDFFADNKFNLFEKENIYLLLSGDDIIWIIGKRLDDRYKITKETTEILKITMKI